MKVIGSANPFAETIQLITIYKDTPNICLDNTNYSNQLSDLMLYAKDLIFARKLIDIDVGQQILVEFKLRN